MKLTRSLIIITLTACAVALTGCANGGGNARSGARAGTRTRPVVPNGSRNANPLAALGNNVSKAVNGTNNTGTSKAVVQNRQNAAKSFDDFMNKSSKSLSDIISGGDGKGPTAHANALSKKASGR